MMNSLVIFILYLFFNFFKKVVDDDISKAIGTQERVDDSSLRLNRYFFLN